MKMILTIKDSDQRLKILNRIKEIYSDRLYIWGNGLYSQVIKGFLVENEYRGQIITIVDDVYYESSEINVIPFSKFVRIEKLDVPIIFGFYNYQIILEKKAKWLSRFPHLYDFHFAVANGKRLSWDPVLAKERENEYRKTYEMLHDEPSKRVMQLYLNAATAGEFHKLFVECYKEPSYFNQITKDLKIDTLVDCGAYDGDSIHDFVSVFPNYKSIIALEPDLQNCSKIYKRKQQERIRDLIVINKGVGAQTGSIRFQGNGKSSSFVSDQGNTEVQILKLDDICSDITSNLMIKMDIEGAELNALYGAKNLIREKSPVLAICVYHKEEDLIEIPQFIQNTAGEGIYNFFLGFHGLDLAELVFYAVPKNY